MKPSRHGGPYRVGVLGGGQLGRMLALAAAPLGIRVIALDPGGSSSPAGQVCPGSLAGSFTDPAAIRELAAMVDVLTVEIEHVDATALSNAAAAAGIPAHPSPATIALIQDKYLQKEAMAKRGVPLGKFKGVDTEEELLAAVKEFGFPAMVKSRLGAYDGRGNFAVHKEEEVSAAWQALNRVGGGGLFVEAWVPFVRELSVIVVKGTDGSLAAYPPVHTIQKDSICHLVFAPCGPTPGKHSGGTAPPTTTTTAASITVPPLPPTQVALEAVGALEGAGVYGVELFELVGGGCLLNEIAPRVHNSGHYSTEGAKCSQFEQHIRAVCGLPLGPTGLRVPAAAMVNILASGGEGEGVLPPLACAALSHPGGASLHWYSKGGVSKAGRKVGHITVTGGSVGEVRRSVDALLAAAAAAAATVGVVAGSGGSGSGSSGSAISTPPLPPVVGIVMGSDSDLGCMAGAAEVLQAFGVAYEITLVSAHRTPGRLEEYGRGARARGLKVIIAGAGGAAHLPGMLASITPLPVIGVPVPLKHLDGVDSLYSILQMPKGVPVATMAIGNAANAGLMAVRILGGGGGGGEEGLLEKMEEYQKKMEGEVLEKAAKLERIGWEQYLKEKK